MRYPMDEVPGITQLRIERGLNRLAAGVEALPGVARRWDGMPEEQRRAFSREWEEMVKESLGEVHGYYLRRGMRPDQYERYKRLLGDLEKGEPVIGRLGLYPPRRILLGAEEERVVPGKRRKEPPEGMRRRKLGGPWWRRMLM
jgi:hypothetical protein